MHKYFFRYGMIIILFMICATCSAKSFNPSLFSYDDNSAVKLSVLSSKTTDGVTVQSITYSGPGLSRNVGAYLVAPEKPGVYPAIIYLHMYPGASKEQFLEEGTTLAKKGSVCLLLEGLFPWQEKPKNINTDMKMIIRQIIELRRGIDLLCMQKNVDATRIAFVGMDYGAMHGMLLSGIESRVSYYVIIAGAPRFPQWNGIFINDAFMPDYAKKIAVLDPINNVSHATAKGFLFQYSENDEWVQKEDAQLLYDAVTRPKKIEWYESGHAATGSTSEKERMIWLIENLSLK
ncbi:MAG TPA: hypothetical protein VF857_10065 [Spirochaetota bacterium]